MQTKFYPLFGGLIAAAFLFPYSLKAQSNTSKTITLSIAQNCGQESEVSFIEPDRNYNNDSVVNVYAWTQGGELNVNRPMYKFDMGMIPVGAVITSAKLSLYNSQSGLDDSGENQFYIERITEAWDPSKVTWNTQPGSTTENAVLVAATTEVRQDFANIDVSTLVQDMVDKGNYGFKLRLDIESPYRNVTLATSAHTNEALHPKLEITYELRTNCMTIKHDACSGKDVEVGMLSNNQADYSTRRTATAYAWTQGGILNVCRPMMEFDLSLIPEGVDITSASFSFFYNPEYVIKHSGDNAFYIERITSGWNNMTHWDDQPTTTPDNRVTVPATLGDEDNFENIEATALITDMYQNQDKTFGIMLKLVVEQPYRNVSIGTFNESNQDLHPRLNVCWNAASGVETIALTKSKLSVYPNPGNGDAQISLDLAVTEKGSLILTDITGRVVKTIAVNTTFTAGSNQVKLNASGELKSGVYQLRYSSENQSLVKSLVVN